MTPTKTSRKEEQSTPQELQYGRHVLSPKKMPPQENEENFVLKSPKKPLPNLEIAKPGNQCVTLFLTCFDKKKKSHLQITLNL